MSEENIKAKVQRMGDSVVRSILSQLERRGTDACEWKLLVSKVYDAVRDAYDACDTVPTEPQWRASAMKLLETDKLVQESATRLRMGIVTGAEEAIRRDLPMPGA
jgi:hypothetical protein